MRAFLCVSSSRRHVAFDNHAASRTIPISAPAPTIVNPAARRIYRPAFPRGRRATTFLPLNHTFIVSLPVSPSTRDGHTSPACHRCVDVPVRSAVVASFARSAIKIDYLYSEQYRETDDVGKHGSTLRLPGVAMRLQSDKHAPCGTIPYFSHKCE